MKYYNEQFYFAKVIIISVAVAIFVGGIGIFAYKSISVELPKDFIFFATVFAMTIATVYAIIAGFTIFIAFNRYQNFNNIINQEVSCLGDILDFTQYLSAQDAFKRQIIDNVKNYGISVANDEWPAMEKGNPHPATSSYLKNIIDSINSIDLANNKNAIVFESFINRVKDLTTFRANRLKEAKEPFPKLLTLTLYVVSAIFLLGIFLIFTPSIFFQTIFLSSTAFVVSLVIQLVNDIGNPCKPGIWHVSKEDYEIIKTSIVTQISDT